jgi:hypothetical protein
MAATRKVNFEFKNQVSPRYVEPLFLQLEYGQWYETTELQHLLRTSGLDVHGKKIVLANTKFWSKLGLGEVQRQRPGRSNLFRLTALGKQVAELFSTNQALFFDVMHYLFYSSWRRSRHLSQAPFWLYAAACDILWESAPSKMDSTGLTARLQFESRDVFPTQDPSFPEQSVRSVFPWLSTLSPPFLSKCGTRSELCSQRRSYCTPQLFHLAVDLAYHSAGLSYGTSLAVGDRQIGIICRVCLLDSERFWEMASLTDMAVREFEIRKGQWGTSLALTGKPRWIELATFSAQEDNEEEENGS